MSIKFVAYGPEHAEQIAQLQTHMWSGDVKRNAVYFRWKYFDNPFVRDPVVFVAMDGTRVVAMRGAFGSAWEAGGSAEPFIVPCADDMVVDPAHRNRGLVRPLMEVLFEELGSRGVQYLFSLSASPVTLVVSLAMGWRAVGSTEPIGRVPRSVDLARRLRARAQRYPATRRFAPRLVLASEREPFRRLDESRRRERRITLVREPRSEEMAALVKRIGGDGRIRHVRDARYLDWRYRHPLAEYRFFYWDEQMLNGYLVLHRNTSDRGNRVRVSIVDWEAVTPKIRLALLDEAIHRGAFANLETWGATLSDPLRSELHKRGFRAAEPGTLRRPGHRILVRRLDAPASDWMLNGRALLDMNQWDLRLVHSMAG